MIYTKDDFYLKQYLTPNLAIPNNTKNLIYNSKKI